MFNLGIPDAAYDAKKQTIYEQTSKCNMDMKRKKCARDGTWWKTREYERLRSKLNHTALGRRGEDAEEREEWKNKRRGKGWYNESAQAALTATVILIALAAIPQRRDATRRDATILFS